MTLLKVLFWISISGISFGYIGYPVVIWLASTFRPQRKQTDFAVKPAVSLIISAYNEVAIIEQKILNALRLNYPKHLLEIIVVSDGSDDGTDQVVERYAHDGVLLKRYPGRIGKTNCLNKAVPDARGEIIVFSDANAMYHSDAILHLVSHFSDERVGLVSGHTRYTAGLDDGTIRSLGIYSRIETFTKKAESRLGSCVGADGAIFALRKQLYRPLRSVDINDFVIPLQVVKLGFTAVLDERAYCTERSSGNHRGEFQRQMRITNRTIRAIINYRELLNPFRFGIFSVALSSHKLLKFLAPFFLIMLGISSVFLIHVGLVYRAAFLGNLILLLLAALGRKGIEYKPIHGMCMLAYTYVMTNAAVLAGWFQFFRGKTDTVWSPVNRMNQN